MHDLCEYPELVVVLFLFFFLLFPVPAIAQKYKNKIIYNAMQKLDVKCCVECQSL